MTYQWLDNEAVERLLKDICRANAGEFDIASIANAPVLADYKTALGYAFALQGVVRGHPRLRDGKEIVTSQLFYLNQELGIARTMSRWYRLGKRDQDRGN